MVSYWDRLARLYALDVTGDGSDDIVSFNFQPGNNGIFDFFATLPGDGDGTLGAVIGSGSYLDATNDPLINQLGFFGASTMSIADYNGDNLPDIISLSSGDDNVMLGFWGGNGDGSFSYPSALQSLPEELHVGDIFVPTGAALRPLSHGDIDLDGDLDLAIGSSTNFVLLMINDGNGNFSESDRVIVGDDPVRVALVDLDLDGLLDIVSANQESKTLGISWGQSDGSFGERGDTEERFTERLLDSDTQFGDLLIVDIDKNGYPDILYAESASEKDGFADGSVQIILNPGL